MSEEKPRAFTQEEIQEKFLRYLWNMVDYWEKEDRTPTSRGKLEGLMHSFLTTLDGMAMALPAFEIIPIPHEEDKQFHIDEGTNYYPEPPDLSEAVTVHGGSILNDIMYSFGRERGLCK